MPSKVLLLPVVSVVAWTMVMWAWMYATRATRIPAIRAMNMKLDPTAPRGEQMAALAPGVRWKADNYNHLMEQPTQFYAVAIALALAGGTVVDVYLAWLYVGLRVIHSVFQATVNKIEVRFSFFLLSSLTLIGLTVRAVLALVYRNMPGAAGGNERQCELKCSVQRHGLVRSHCDAEARAMLHAAR